MIHANRESLWMLLTVAGLTCCSPVGDEVPISPSWVLRDSAGVRITENSTMVWEEESGWQIDRTPLMVIGSTRNFEEQSRDSTGIAEDQIPLERDQGVEILSDGRIVVADAGSRKVMVFDTTGRLASSFWGVGQGPGEVTDIQYLHVVQFSVGDMNECRNVAAQIQEGMKFDRRFCAPEMSPGKYT